MENTAAVSTNSQMTSLARHRPPSSTAPSKHLPCSFCRWWFVRARLVAGYFRSCPAWRGAVGPVPQASPAERSRVGAERDARTPAALVGTADGSRPVPRVAAAVSRRALAGHRGHVRAIPESKAAAPRADAWSPRHRSAGLLAHLAVRAPPQQRRVLCACFSSVGLSAGSGVARSCWARSRLVCACFRFGVWLSSVP